jgi:hypothetical protein
MRVGDFGFNEIQPGPVSFDVPQEHWEKILTALQPAKFDPSPAKWVGFADIDGKTNDGEPFYIGLFWTPDPPGAFAAGTTFETRYYYRGGDSTKLLQAVKNAYFASKK